MNSFANAKLQGKKVAIVATDGFEWVELTEPKKFLEAAGAQVEVISLQSGAIKGSVEEDFGHSGEVAVDKLIDEARVADYDALVLPGGFINPDKLRIHQNVVNFVGEFARSGKPVAAICHGPWTLVETGFLRGKKLTSWPSLQTDLKNAGAHWVDESVVVDGNLITSRKPDDIPHFNQQIEEALLRVFALA